MTAQILAELGKVFTNIPFNRMLGLKLEHLDDAQVTISFEMKEELIGNFMQGILHGGVISSVLDMAGGILVMGSIIYKNPNESKQNLAKKLGSTSTIDLNINFLSPGRGTQFTAKAWLIKSGSKIAFTRMELLNQDQELIATGTAIYFMK